MADKNAIYFQRNSKHSSLASDIWTICVRCLCQSSKTSIMHKFLLLSIKTYCRRQPGCQATPNKHIVFMICSLTAYDIVLVLVSLLLLLSLSLLLRLLLFSIHSSVCRVTRLDSTQLNSTRLLPRPSPVKRHCQCFCA